MTDVVVPLTGWGRGTWGQLGWGEGSITNSGAAGQVGSVTIVAEANVPVTGLEATANVGSVLVQANADVSVTGVSATGNVGSVTVIGTANVFPTGLEATGQVGTATISGDAIVPVTGLEATGNVGSVTVQANADVSVTGLEATGAVGTVTTGSDANVSVTGVSADAITPMGGGPEFTADGTAQLSTAQAKFGPSSLLLDGTDDFVTSDDNIDLSSGDFTVDMWIRPTSVTGYKGLWQTGTSSLLNVYLIGNQVQGVVGGSTTLFLSSTRISPNVWTMISVEREGNVHRLYINGALEASSSTGNRPDDGVFAIGKNGFGDFNGYIDELRLSSVARYGGTSFTEPTANYAVDSDTNSLLHFDGTNGSTEIINETRGGVTVEADANVTIPSGLQAQGFVYGGYIPVEAGATAQVSGLEATSAVGSVVVEIRASVEVTGVSGTGEVGSVTVNADANVPVSGLQATGSVGQVLVYGRIVPNQNPSYSEETPVQSPGYSEETPSQSPSWTRIAA
jgi:hypothetical protein